MACRKWGVGVGVFWDGGRWKCWFIALFARGSVVAKRERRGVRGVALPFASESVGLG